MDTKRIAIITDSELMSHLILSPSTIFVSITSALTILDGSSYESGITITPAEFVARF